MAGKGLARFAAGAVARAREAPVDFALLPPGAVPGSVHSGGAGVALFLLEAARLTGDDGLLEPAGRWLEAARGWGEHASVADWTGFPRGLLFGRTGIAYVEALLAARRGEPAAVLRALVQIDRLSVTFDDLRGDLRPTELVGGAAGVLCAARDLEARLGEAAYGAARDVAVRVRERTTAMVLAVHEASFDPGPRRLLAMAHGAAGELWALAGALGAGHPVVRARLGELAAEKQEDEEGFVFWLPHAEEVEFDMLATWCSGTAGHTLLWSECARQTGRDEWRELARRAAESTSFLEGDNGGLCCGLAGQAIALQRYADLSGDAQLARRASVRLAKATAIMDRLEAYRLGFWQGALGVALACMKRASGERGFPCVEPLGTGAE